METEIKNVLVLTFKQTEDSKLRRIRISNPREDLTGPEVKKVMDMVADNRFLWEEYEVVPQSAKIVKTASDSIDITVE